MGVMSRFRRSLPERHHHERPDTEDKGHNNGEMTPDSIQDPLLRAYLIGSKMDVRRAMSIPAYAACVSLLAGVVSELPIGLYRKRDNKVEEVESDPRVRMLNGDTGDLLRGPEMMRRFVMDYFNRKGAFIYANWVDDELISLHYVRPDAVTVNCDETDHIFKRAWFTVDGRNYWPWQFVYACRNAFDGVNGIPMVEQAEDPLNTAYLTLKHERGLMQRGGNKRGYLKSARKITDPVLEKLKEAFSRMYNDDSENVIALNEGIEFQEASETSVEMQLAERKKANSDDIYSLFLIPPTLIRGGADEDDHKNFVNYTLQPLLEIIRSALNTALLREDEKEQGYYFDFDLKEFTKASMRERWQAWATAKKNGMVNADEFREFENLPPLGMNYINLGLNDVLMDPVTHDIIVPNMGTIIDPNDVTSAAPARTPQSVTPNRNQGGDKSGSESTRR